MPSVVTKRRAERTASQKSSRCLPVATEHAANESPATIGKANWGNRIVGSPWFPLVPLGSPWFPPPGKKRIYLGCYLVDPGGTLKLYESFSSRSPAAESWRVSTTWNGLGKVLVSWEGLRTTTHLK